MKQFMKKHMALLVLLFLHQIATAQKKLIPVSQSPLTGISLPAGSRQDQRFLSEIAGKSLLEMETKKSGMNIAKTEFLVIPSSTDFHTTIDSLKQVLQNAGWMLSPAYDINPAPHGSGLSLNISADDNSLDFELALSVAPQFRVNMPRAEEIIMTIKFIVSRWHEVALKLKIPRIEVESMRPAFRV